MNLVEKTSTTFLGEPIEDEFEHFIEGETEDVMQYGREIERSLFGHDLSYVT